MINLHEIGRRLGYRTGWDEARLGREKDPWLMTLPGRYGHVYVTGRSQLAISTTSRRAKKIMQVVPDCCHLQRGDDGWNISFPTEHLATIAPMIGLKKRRILSEKQRILCSERLAKWKATQ